MDDMIDRVAAAIFDAKNGIDGDQVGDMIYENFRIGGDRDEAMARTMDVCRMAAAAAIAAMLKPTAAMVQAGRKEIDDYFSGGGTSGAPPEDIYVAMIDAALGPVQRIKE